MSAYVDARPTPVAELRTSLGLVMLAAALAHVMGASHAAGGIWPAGIPFLAMALVQGALAAGVGLMGRRALLVFVAAAFSGFGHVGH